MHGGGGGGGGRLMRTAPLSESDRRPVTSRTVRRILQFFRPYRLRVALAVVAIIAAAVIGLANPFLLKLIIDEAIPDRDLDRLYLYVALMIALPIATGLIGVGQTYLNTVIGQSVMQDLRSALYGHLQRMPLRFFTSTRTGEIQARLSSDVSGVQQVVTDRQQSGDRHLHGFRDVADFLADDADFARSSAHFSLRDVQGRRGAARGQDGNARNDRRYDVSGGGDAFCQRDAADQGVWPPEPGGCGFPGNQ